MIYTTMLVLAVSGPKFMTLLPTVRAVIVAGLVAQVVPLLLNARRWHTAASAWNVFSVQVMFRWIGRMEPDEAHHEVDKPRKRAIAGATRTTPRSVA